MARKGTTKKREIAPDHRFNNTLVAKMITCIMRQGKKSIAENIVYAALQALIIKGEDISPIQIFEQSIANVTPQIEVRPRRIGGATYQIPMEVPAHRATALALRWLVTSAKARAGKSMIERLTNELLDAYHSRGGAITMRENKRKMAEANKAFAHYRW